METQYRFEARGFAAKTMTRRTMLMLCAGAASAQTRQEKGRKVVDEALEALGGERFRSMQDRVEAGRAYSFYRERLSGLSVAKVYTRYLTPAPGVPSVRERQSFGKDEDSAVLFTERDAWEVTFRGARPLPDPVRDRYRDSTLRNILYILHQRLAEPGLIFESKGSEVLDNQPVEIVDITDSDNRSVTVYFHKSTKMPVRQVFFRRDPLTKERIEEVSLFAKYRDVGGGVQWPFNILRQRNGEKIYEIFSESVTINQGLTDALFTLPSTMKILKSQN
jgi:hypothetical protein